jgi:hypothetical protein
MKKLLLIVLLLTSCVGKKYKYEIRGKEYVTSKGITTIHDAIWYTDTFTFNGDTLYYSNSNGKQVIILPPYNLKKNY